MKILNKLMTVTFVAIITLAATVFGLAFRADRKASSYESLPTHRKVLGPKDKFEAGRNISYWKKETTALLEEGKKKEAAKAAAKALTGAERPPAHVRAGNAIGRFF